MTEQISLAAIQGQLDAVTHLCAALAATASPTAAHIVVVQAERAVENAKQSGKPEPYVAGYAAAAQQILTAVRLASEAEKIRSVSGDAKH